jgi:hypothetical protein
MAYEPDEAEEPGPLGWKALVLIVAFHAGALAIATHPAVWNFRRGMAANPDAWVHLWTLRWYKTCLLEHRSILLCPEIQFPAGASLGSLSPMHFQALIYLPLSFVIPSDTICYNILWITGLMLTGLGTTLLAWHMLGHRACAAFAGLLGMLSAPLMIHASAHLDLIYLGWFPVFLVQWMRFVDRPDWRTLAAAVLSYVLLSMCHAYYMVFAVFPAVLYVAWSAWRNGLPALAPWLRRRLPWFAGMVGLVLPCLLVLFAGHIWTILQGTALERPRTEFDQYSAPLWGYATPSRMHYLGALLPFDPYASFGLSAPERIPYLGLVTIALLVYAAIRRPALRRASYAWSALLLVVVISLGSYCRVGAWELSLPASWLWDLFPPMRLTRVPARLSLLAGVLAGVVAAAGLKDLLSRIRSRTGSTALFGAVSVLAVADLAIIGFPKAPPPEMPGCYAFLKQLDPRATLLEIPYNNVAGTYLYGQCTYWQSLHRLTTSAGYTAHDNALQDSWIGPSCPFHVARLMKKDFLEDPANFHVDPLTAVDFKQYVWLYLTANRFDFVVLHKPAGDVPEYRVSLERIASLLQDCKIYEDRATIVYARSRLEPPSGLVQMTRGGWSKRNYWQGEWNWLLARTGGIVVYNPDPDRDLVLTLDMAALRTAQSVRLRSGGETLAAWDVKPDFFQLVSSPPFRLARGFQELTIESIAQRTGQDRKSRARAQKRPYHLRVAGLKLSAIPERGRIARRNTENALREGRSTQ